MAAMTHDELVQLLQDGRIGYLQYVMTGENGTKYLEWCKGHSIEPSDESAEFFVEETEIDAMEMQLIENEEYGIWN